MRLHIANIDDHLDMVLPLLSDLCRRDNPDWSIGDAVEACRTGRWMLVVGEEPGFAMFSIKEMRFSRGLQLFIEVTCHPNSSVTVDHYQPFWDMAAEKLGCAEIAMASKRRGWERKGWQGGWIQYSRSVQEVTHGE